jgi:subtilisin family serine protease
MSIGTTNIYRTVFNGFAAKLTPAQMQTLASDPRVLAVRPNRTLHMEKTAAPAVANGDVPQIVTREARRIGLLNSPTAHVGLRGKAIDADIAIVDTGIDPLHPDLNVAGGYNCTTSHHQQWADDEGHGTIVAGVAAARDNKIDIVGIAPGARLWAVKVLTSQLDGTDASLLCGIDWVASHSKTIEVANFSLGGTADGAPPGQFYDDTTCGSSTGDIFHPAFCRLHDRGVVTVAAAGNSSADARTTTPAAYPEVITVSGLVDSDGRPGGLGTPDPCLGLPDDTFAYFSNYGPPIDIAAPAVCVASTYPEPDAVAVGSGTSFAAPFVTGAAALLLFRHPDLTPTQVQQILLDTAEAGPIPGDPDGLAEGVLNIAGY